MPVSRAAAAAVAALILFSAWRPWWGVAAGAFSRHMTTHMLLVALAAPLMALAIARSPIDPLERWPRLITPVPASFIDLFVVWSWHTPALHRAAAGHALAMAAEQVSFLLAGWVLWAAILCGPPRGASARAAAGVVALVLTFAHMTLLGALFALTPRLLYAGHHAVDTSLADQQLGGAIMIAASALTYLPAALWLAWTLLRDGRPQVAA